MKILFIHDHEVNPFKGGIQRVSYLLAEEFTRRGHSTLFLSFEHDSQEFSGKGKIPQDIISFQQTGEYDRKHAVEKYIREKGIDLIILQHPNPRYWNYLKELTHIAKTVFVFHNQPYPLLGKERIIKRLTPSSHLKLKGKILRLIGIGLPKIFRKIYLRQFGATYNSIAQNVDSFILLSERYRPRLIDNTPGIESNKVIAINNPTTFSTEETTVDFNGKENIVLVVCRISNPQKNLTGFIDVWKEFSKRERDWKAIIVGDGENRNIIEAYARKTGVERLQFEGNRENVEAYYRKSKIFCMTSSYEGLAMVLMESMAFGCVPVVYDTFEAVHDIITDSENGLIIPAFDKEAMVNSLVDLANNPEKLKKMAYSGPTKLKRFSCSKIADQWEDKVMGNTGMKK